MDVSREADLPSLAAASRRDPQDGPDPELLALPDPPRGARTFTLAVLALAVVMALAMVVALRHELVYALAQGAPADLGDLRTVSAATLAANDNRPVRADARLGAAGGIRYERALSADTFRTLPVIGRADVWVDLRVPAGQEGGRWEPPQSFAGRLVRFDTAGPRHRGLAEAIEHATRERVPRGAWLLVEGEGPAHARWALVLAVIFLGFAAWNAAAIVRIVRRVKV